MHTRHCTKRAKTSVKQGTTKEDGWNAYPYSVSKACLNAVTIILARENPHLLINACCPGWVDTEMGNIAGSKPPKTAGRVLIILFLFILPQLIYL